MKKFKLLGVVSAIALTAGALVACGPKTDSDLPTVRLGLHPNYGASAGYTALDNGFFEKAGVNVEKSVAGGPQCAAALLAGEIDVSFMGGGVAWNYFTENSNIKIVA